MVAAPFNGSGWYRGEIKDIVPRNDDWKADRNNNNQSDEDLIDLYYIDFGDSAYVEQSSTRKLLREFNELPSQAIRCSLDNVEPADTDRWSDSAINFFEDITYSCQWKELKARLVQFNDSGKSKPIPSINLYDPLKVLNDISSTASIDARHSILSLNLRTNSMISESKWCVRAMRSTHLWLISSDSTNLSFLLLSNNVHNSQSSTR